MEIAVIIVSILLIAIVLLQSGKAESANIIQGGSSELFQNRKERGLDFKIQIDGGITLDNVKEVMDAGVDIAVVNRFIKQFEQSQKMMKQMSGMMGKRGRMRFPF